jgi:hypothetical protein
MNFRGRFPKKHPSARNCSCGCRVVLALDVARGRGVRGSDCGPLSVAISDGRVINCATPIMFDMFSPVADHGPTWRSR